MPKTINIGFTEGKSHLGGMIITAHAEGRAKPGELLPVPNPEKPHHGAPDTIQLVQGAMAKDPYWEVAKKLRQSLDQTPDYANVRSAEVNTGDWRNFTDPKGIEPDWNYPNTKGRHNLSGGKHATIDGIRRDNIATVAVKSLRELRAMGAIDETDYKSALTQIAMADIGSVTPVTSEPKYKPGAEHVPSYRVNGYGMSRASQDYLAADPPKPVVAEPDTLAPPRGRSMAM